jgi:hypothetical protein
MITGKVPPTSLSSLLLMNPTIQTILIHLHLYVTKLTLICSLGVNLGVLT